MSDEQTLWDALEECLNTDPYPVLIPAQVELDVQLIADYPVLLQYVATSVP